jgi:hypothetical protein
MHDQRGRGGVQRPGAQPGTAAVAVAVAVVAGQLAEPADVAGFVLALRAVVIAPGAELVASGVGAHRPMVSRPGSR